MEGVGLEGDDAEMRVAVKSEVVPLEASEGEKGRWVDRDSVALGNREEEAEVEGEGVEGGSVMSSSGDIVSLGKASVGVGEVGRGGSGEGENVGRDKVGVLVSLSMEVVSPGFSMSFVGAAV